MKINHMEEIKYSIKEYYNSFIEIMENINYLKEDIKKLDDSYAEVLDGKTIKIIKKFILQNEFSKEKSEKTEKVNDGFVYFLALNNKEGVKIGKANSYNRIIDLLNVYDFNLNESIAIKFHNENVISIEKMFHKFYNKFKINLFENEKCDGYTEFFSYDVHKYLKDDYVTVLKHYDNYEIYNINDNFIKMEDRSA